MVLWTTALKTNSEAITQVTITCGIYQCDALFPTVDLHKPQSSKPAVPNTRAMGRES